MRKALVVLVLAILFVSAIGPGEGQEGEEEEIILKETRITNDSAVQNYPKIYNNYIVWEDERNIQNPFESFSEENYDIYGYNLDTDVEFQITEDQSKQAKPAIWGDIVTWGDWGNDTNGIGIYNLTVMEEVSAMLNHNTKKLPYNIYDDTIVWSGRNDENYTIELYYLSSNSDEIMQENNFKMSNPCIWGSWVVWEDERANNVDIYAYNFVSDEERVISDNPKSEGSPQIYNDHIVFADSSQKVFLYDLSTRDLKIINPNEGGSFPVIYDEYVVMVGVGMGIVIYEISSGTIFPLIDPKGISSYDFYENKLVYSKDSDIYLLEFSFPQSPEPSFWEQNRMSIGLGITILIIALVFALINRGKKKSPKT
jgi:beta propeller repeat protein